MTLKNNANIVFVCDSLMAIFFLVLLVDWRNAIIMCIIGTIAGALLYLATTEILSFPIDYLQRLPTFILTMIGGYLFKYSNSLFDRMDEKIKSARSTAGSIAHELRNPLNSINLAQNQAGELLEELLSESASASSSQSSQNINQNIKKQLADINSSISSSVTRANNTINIILSDLSDKPIEESNFSYLSTDKGTVESQNQSRIFLQKTKSWKFCQKFL